MVNPATESEARKSVQYVEDSEPGKAHEVKPETAQMILAKHSEEQNYALGRHQRALEFLAEVGPAMNDLACYIAAGTISYNLALKRMKAAWQESFSEAIAQQALDKETTLDA